MIKKTIDFWNTKVYGRLNDEMHKKLLEYCEKNNITKAEAIRQGIHLLLSQDKK